MALEADIITWEDALDDALAEVRAGMIERHMKYGAGNIAAFGELGLVIRLSDKIERLKNTINLHDPLGPVPDKHTDDSVADTYRDIIGYGVIAKMWRSGYWFLPLEEAP